MKEVALIAMTSAALLDFAFIALVAANHASADEWKHRLEGAASILFGLGMFAMIAATIVLYNLQNS